MRLLLTPIGAARERHTSLFDHRAPRSRSSAEMMPSIWNIVMLLVRLLSSEISSQYTGASVRAKLSASSSDTGS